MKIPWWLNPWRSYRLAMLAGLDGRNRANDLQQQRDIANIWRREMQTKLASMNVDKWVQSRELNRQLRSTIEERDEKIDRLEDALRNAGVTVVPYETYPVAERPLVVRGEPWSERRVTLGDETFS